MNTLKDFLVSVGFKVDEASHAKAKAAVRDTEETITGLGEKELARRAKLEDEAHRRVEKKQIERDKRDKARRNDGMKDLTKSVQQFETMASRVQTAVTAASMAFVDTKLLNGVKEAAQAYSRLSLQSQRTGAAPSKIAGLMYGLGQMGVERGTAESSFERFSSALKDQPGLKNRLEAGGVRFKDAQGKDRDRADVFGDLGNYFKKLPLNVARAQASSMGLDADSLLPVLTKRQAELQEKVKEFGKMQSGFGLDPEKASDDGRKFSAEYDRLAAHLLTVKDKIAADFFKPLTKMMKSLSETMEAHPDATVKFGEGFVALAALLSLRVIPKLLKLTGLLTGLSKIAPPMWLLRLLGLPAAAAGAGAAGVAALQALPDGQKDQILERHEALQEKNKHHFGGWQWLKDKTGFGKPTGSDAVWARSRKGQRALKRAAGEWNEGNAARGHTSSNVDDLMRHAQDQLAAEGVPEANRRAAAAALVGNVIQESGGNPNLTHDGGTGYGIYGARLGRRDRMLAWLSANGYARNSAEGQARYMAHEAMTDPTYRRTANALRNATPENLGDTTDTVALNFESPVPRTANYAGRRNNAASALARNSRPPKPLAAAPNPYGALVPVGPGQPQGLVSGGYKALGLGADGKPVRLGGSSVTNNTSRGDTNIEHNPTFNISGGNPTQTLEAARRMASRGHQDLLRNLEGAER